MKKNIFFGSVAAVVLLLSSCGKDTGGCFKGEKAWVRDYSDSDTCGIVFELEDGTFLEPTNLAEFQHLDYVHNMLIWVSYKEVSGASICGMGEIVEMKCIEEREY
ncbi:MAG: hypothetical protein IPM74_01600 [Crocinitomicaceae bacterium]|nr:hypothetical protein [Crocinitomicaceae bacterium]MBK8924612.1 hypothetical protein [Crocinitomicaceae bacterium]